LHETQIKISWLSLLMPDCQRYALHNVKRTKSSLGMATDKEDT